MKTIKSIIKSAVCATAIASMALASTSCSDMLDTKPQGVFTDDQITDEEVDGFLTSA